MSEPKSPKKTRKDFYGSHQVTLDSKGRVVIPKIFLNILKINSGISEDQKTFSIPLIMTVGTKGALSIFHEDVFVEQINKINEKFEDEDYSVGESDKIELDAMERKARHSWCLKVDQNAKILIPMHFRAYLLGHLMEEKVKTGQEEDDNSEDLIESPSNTLVFYSKTNYINLIGLNRYVEILYEDSNFLTEKTDARVPTKGIKFTPVRAS